MPGAADGRLLEESLMIAGVFQFIGNSSGDHVDYSSARATAIT
jgi:hypothetical protein